MIFAPSLREPAGAQAVREPAVHAAGNAGPLYCDYQLYCFMCIVMSCNCINIIIISSSSSSITNSSIIGMLCYIMRVL